MSDEGWVVVAQFTGSDADVEANMLMAYLESAEIQVKRLPIQSPATVLAGAMDQPVVLFVPEELEQEAKEAIDAYVGDTPE